MRCFRLSDYTIKFRKMQEKRRNMAGRCIRYAFPQYPSQNGEHSHDNGWELKDIQPWLGHADIGTTGNIYIYLTQLRKENIGKDLEKVFRR